MCIRDRINEVAEKNKKGTVNLTVLRGVDTVNLVSKVSEEGRVGIYMLNYEPVSYTHLTLPTSDLV